MRKPAIDLDDVCVAAPCPVKWESMEGDERVRFCSLCELNVYNVSKMTRKEATEFLESEAMQAGQVCVQLHRRPDGTLLTRDCPVGRRLADAFKKRAVAAVAFIVALLNGSPAIAENDREIKQPQEKKQVPVFPGMICPPPVNKKNENKNETEKVTGNKTQETGKERGKDQPKPDTTARDAFLKAQELEQQKKPGEAIKEYERSVEALRDKSLPYDPVFKKKVAKAYAALLRKQKQKSRAAAIEKEFTKP